MSKIKFFIVIVFIFILNMFSAGSVFAAEHCDDQFYIDRTLANGAKWDMCWSHDKNQGIRYHHIFYTPKNGARKMVLFDASIAQIHVPYDDNGARFHDVSDFGLGDDGASNNNLVSLSATECLSGVLSNYNSKAAVCHRVISSGSAYRKGSARNDSQLLKVFSISKVGQYIYGIEWDFYDNGIIKPSIVATGALQRFSTTGDESHGWIIDSNNRVGLAHMHNFYWRLDFDINGTGNNDIVQEVNFSTSQGRRSKSLTTLTSESARSVNPSTMRTWLIKDGSATNRKGHGISYEIRLNEAGQREIGPSNEPFTNNDFYVTRSKDCELFASHNSAVNNCAADDLSEFVSGESIVDQDIVAWVGVSFYHLPRSEDAPKMDAHVSGFELIPRDWHTTNPSLDEPPELTLRLSATDDTATAPSVMILIDVMDNDTGQSISLNTVDNPSNGSAIIVGNQIQYTPNANFIGIDTFAYSIKDTLGGVFAANVTVTVTTAGDSGVTSPNNNGGVDSGGGGAMSILNLLSAMFILTLFRFIKLRRFIGIGVESI